MAITNKAVIVHHCPPAPVICYFPRFCIPPSPCLCLTGEIDLSTNGLASLSPGSGKVLQFFISSPAALSAVSWIRLAKDNSNDQKNIHKHLFMFIWSFESQSTNICKHRKATNFNAMVTHKSVKQWQRFSLSRRQEYFKKFFQTILQETFTGSRHFASPVSWLMLASSSSSSLCTVCLWAVSSSCINWIARGKDWWDLWKQEPSICKSSKSAFSQPRYNLVQPFAAFYFKIFVQLKSSVQNLFQIAHHLKTWISTDTNSFGCGKQNIFF